MGRTVERSTMLIVGAVAALALRSPGQAATWEQSSWRTETYYRSTFAVGAATPGSLYVAAADSYTVYLNGIRVGSDSLATRALAAPVQLSRGDNDIAVHVVNRGLGAGHGLALAIATDTLGVFGTTTDRTRQTWYWTETPQVGTTWLRQDVDDHDDWSTVQEGSADFSTVEAPLGTFIDSSVVTTVAGFAGGVDLGGGGIRLKVIDGENLALGRPCNRIEVVDGDLGTSWDPPVNALNFSASMDLQVRRNIHGVRVITRGATEAQLVDNSLRGYSVQISDDQIRWSEVAVLHDITDYARTEARFRPTWTRYIRVVIIEINAVTQPRVAEVQVYGAGHTEKGTFVSAPIAAGTPGVAKNFGRVDWEAEVPERTELTVQFRSGDSLAEFAEPDSGWSAPVAQGGYSFPAAEPARYFQYRVNMSTRDDTRTPVFRRLTVEYEDGAVAATSALGRVTPGRVPMGVDTTFTYVLDVQVGAGDAGVARIDLAVPSNAELGDMAGQPVDVARWYSGQGLLTLELATPLSSSAQVVIPFRARTYATTHAFRAFVYAPGSDEPLNARQNTGTDPQTGEAYAWTLLATTSLEQALTQVAATPAAFTPNGDGRNDVTVIEFSLAKVSVPRQVDIHIYDLRGRRVRDLAVGLLGAGTYGRSGGSGGAAAPGEWDGRDDAGALVPPGIYVYRVSVDLDTSDEVRAGTVAVVY